MRGQSIFVFFARALYSQFSLDFELVIIFMIEVAFYRAEMSKNGRKSRTPNMHVTPLPATKRRGEFEAPKAVIHQSLTIHHIIHKNLVHPLF